MAEVTAARVFKTRMSKWIAYFYWSVLALFVLLLAVTWLFAEMPAGAFYVTVSAFGFLILLFAHIIYRAYTMRFIVTQRHIVVRGAFKTYNVRLSNIGSINKTLIPLAFRVWGASFLGGYYYIPSLGFARIAMTNFEDGVLVTVKRKSGRVKNYLMTPKDPTAFIRAVRRGMRKGK